MAATSSARETYTNLAEKLKEISYLRGISGLLEWDQSVMMPENAAEARGKQMGVIAAVIHDKATDKGLGVLIEALANQNQDEFNEYERAVIRDAKRNYDLETKVPAELAKQAAELSSEGYGVWVQARKNNDFKSFAPILKKWIALLKEKSKSIDPTKRAYDVCLDSFERGMTCDRLDQIFSKVKAGLVPLIEDIKAKPQIDGTALDGTFEVPTQVKLCQQVAKDLGFDLTMGRIDVSVHPFTGGAHSTDVRITTRYKDNTLLESITGTVHETGHALYEQGRNKEYADLPVGEALSMGIHESQSLLWERMVGQSFGFWKWFVPKMVSFFPQLGDKAQIKDVYNAVNLVKPAFIRVEADEVTYPLHVILRYELERDLIEGTIQVDDLPQLWNQKMQQYLGITPKTDTEGVLQDTHWSCGLFGYFPSYTLGAIYASQFYAKASQVIPDLEVKVESGQFKELKEWLNTNIHVKGSLYPGGDELAKVVTGQPLNPEIFLEYLKQKYTALYGL